MPLNLLAQRIMPSCLRPAMDEEPATDRRASARETACNASDDWRYRPHEHGPPAAFARHPDFQRFREHIAALTRELSAIVQDCPSSVANLQTFLEHVTKVEPNGDNPFFGQRAAEIYDQGAALLDRLAGLIRDPRTDRAQARAEIRELSRPLALCVVAVMEELPSSLQRLSPPTQSFAAKWHDAQVRLIEQSAIETLRLSDLETTDRHAVHALLPILYEYAGLPDRLPHDPFVWRHLPKSLIKEAKRRLASDMNLSAHSSLIADDYLMRLNAAMQEKGAATSHAPLLTLARMEAAIEALSTEFGSKPLPSAVFRVDPDDGTCSVTTDTTLLAVHFLDCWRSQLASRKLGKARRPVPVGTPPEGTTFLRFGDLAWAETRGERRPLELDDLPALKPGDLARLALASVIRNSAPDDLWTALPAEWMRDTAAFDALLDRIDDTALRACFERWQSSPIPLSKDQQKMLRAAVLDRGRGGALFEGAMLAWQRLTLPDIQDLEGLRTLYRRHLAGEVTTDALRNHLSTSWNAAMSERLPYLMRMSAPALPQEACLERVAGPAKEWLFAAAEALSAAPPQVGIDDIANALRLGPSAKAPTGPDHDWPLSVQVPYSAIHFLGGAQMMLDSTDRAQTLRPEHARRLLRELLSPDDRGRSRLLQSLWLHPQIKTSAFFVFLTTALRAMAKRGCHWSELNALLEIEGGGRDPEARQRLAYTRTSILYHSYPDGPAEIGLLPEGFSQMPTERRTFRDVAIQHDDMDAQA